MAGSITARGKNKWLLRWDVPTDDGNRRQASRVVEGTKREARAALDALVASAQRADRGGRFTVAEMMEMYLAQCRAIGLAENTLYNYQWRAERHVVPAFGDLRLEQLTVSKIEAGWTRLAATSNVSPENLEPSHGLLRSALNDAVRRGWLTSNPAALAKLSKTRYRELSVPNADDVQLLIQRARQRDLSNFIALSALTGTRVGELSAVRLSAIDIDAGVEWIRSSIRAVPGSERSEGPTKTGKSRRIHLEETALAFVRDQIALVRAAAEEHGVELVDDPFLFPASVDGGKPMRPNTISTRFSRLRDSLGLSCRLHDLRHFTATYLADAGLGVAVISNRLGHSSSAITLRVYTHWLEDSDATAAAVMGSALAPAAPVLDTA